ncbi:glycoside hydrolase family 65 protein [Streptomyces laculatispora]|uniref:Glycoside hydrolase family 65 protein n=1 Tax=Streptomyces laculatispora TaxID=887464 RepID=A0ABY9HYZ7_9ACTN|nr:glycoside hydrolase family 65 protein [Streptomyces laculatispora]WLQ39574.1 glycoside hydrolase family 65 protein [Streptomyces laculatispora]
MTASWTWSYSAYDPKAEHLVETLCTLGNGRFATRGSAPECPADTVHYPGTYMAGCYDRLTSVVAGRRVENEDMVNLPNWTLLRYRCLPEGGPPGEWLTPDSEDLQRYSVSLDLRAGILTHRLLFRDAEGRGLRVTHHRIVHMGNPRLAAQRSLFHAYGWSGTLEIESVLDGDVTNAGVERYRELDGRHLRAHRVGSKPGGVAWLTCRTAESAVRFALTARTLTTPAAPVVDDHTATATVQRCVLPISPGGSAVVTKTIALYTSRDRPADDPLGAALDDVAHAPGFSSLLASHRSAWRSLWHEAELHVPGEAGHILRLHLFHVLQTLSSHSAELDVGVPARGLHGEAYRGHVFWDELFVLPYVTMHFPEVARALLMYRHRRLPAARAAARQAGGSGAMYPWQSAGSGREETQSLHLNPHSGRWLPDHSHLQRHVGSAVALNVWRYAQATGDRGFLHSAGAEILLEVARYWAGAVTFDSGQQRYRLRGVVGPDEYHDAYPEAKTPGIDDNAYTNVTAAWVLARGLDLLDELPDARRRELMEQLSLDETERDRWDDISRRMYVPFHRGVVSQFENYDRLEELDWARYSRRYGDIRRLDRILEAEGDSVNRYQAFKQADTLMLGYLFRPTDLAGLFARLGYRLDDEVWRETVEYYAKRTSHGSTLSSFVHGWVLARQKGPEAWSHMEEALLSDVADIQGGTIGEGIHLGAMAGTLDMVQRGITGLEAGPEGLHVDPVALPEIPRFSFTLCFRGHRGIRIRMMPGRIGISVPVSPLGPLVVLLPEERRVTVPAGSERWFRLPPVI